MQRKAEILWREQQPGLNHPPKHLLQGCEIIPNGPKWLGLNPIPPSHGSIWFITFTFRSRQRGVLIGKWLWRRWFIISLFSLLLCRSRMCLSAASSSIPSASLLLLLGGADKPSKLDVEKRTSCLLGGCADSVYGDGIFSNYRLGAAGKIAEEFWHSFQRFHAGWSRWSRCNTVY